MSALLQAGLGVAGALFGGRKETASEKAARRALEQDMAYREELMKVARGYDPAREDAAAFDFAQRSAGQTLEQSLKNVSANFARAGGVPGGDTGILFNLQRSQDSVMNPLSQMMAERKSSQALRKLQAMQDAVATARPGQLANDYLQLAQGERRDMSGALQMIGQGVDGLMKKSRSPQSIGSENGYQTRLMGGLGAAAQPKGRTSVRKASDWRIRY
jgi:hypothetical protein